MVNYPIRISICNQTEPESSYSIEKDEQGFFCCTKDNEGYPSIRKHPSRQSEVIPLSDIIYTIFKNGTPNSVKEIHRITAARVIVNKVERRGSNSFSVMVDEGMKLKVSRNSVRAVNRDKAA